MGLEERDKSALVIGGGPAGSIFGLLLARSGQDVTIIEPRSAKIPGEGERKSPCVGCAGLLQENVLGLLGSLGLTIPDEVIQTRIHTNALHLPGGRTAEIPTKAITVYRGFGPVQSPPSIRGFDAWLLNKAAEAGAKVVQSGVRDLTLSEEGDFVTTSDGKTIYADLIIGAYGHSKAMLDKVPTEAPTGQTACVREYFIGAERTAKIGNTDHFFIAPTKTIGFGAIFPKSEFISIALMGRGRNGVVPADYKEFLSSEPVIDLVGDLTTAKLSCGCSSVITMQSPKRFFIENEEGGIRMINIGDAGPSRIKKNGIFAALDSASTLAQTLIRYGNTPKALEVYSRYVDKQYLWDNQLAEPVLEFVNFLLQQPVSREIISGLMHSNIPIFSEAIRNSADYLLSGRGPYWQLPFVVLGESLGLSRRKL